MKHRAMITILTISTLTIGWAQQPGRAYRDINFADSFDTVANEIFDDAAFTDGFRPLSLGSATSPREWLSWGMSVNTQISGDRYNVNFEFYDDKLYRMKFTSQSSTADYFDTTVKDRRDSLVNVIRGAHGDPTRINNLGFLDMKSGYVHWSHEWATNDEGVAYFIGISAYEYTYRAVLSVEWSWLRQLIDSLDADRDSEIMRKSQDDF